MQLPRSHAWALLQKWLIITLVVAALAALSEAVYNYERHLRGPSDSVLLGTWQCASGCGSPLYFHFAPNHNVVVDDGEATGLLKGRWYAGEDFIYLRFPGEELRRKRDILSWQIEDIAPNEFHLRTRKDEPPSTYRRIDVASPAAVPKPLQPRR